MDNYVVDMLPGLIVIILVVGLYTLALRILKIPWRAAWDNHTALDPIKANQLVKLTAAYYMLMAGGIWIAAVVMRQFIPFWGMFWLFMGTIYLVQAFVVRPKKSPDASRLRRSQE